MRWTVYAADGRVVIECEPSFELRDALEFGQALIEVATGSTQYVVGGDGE